MPFFVEIGWTPNTGLLDDFVATNDKGEIVVDADGCTSWPGIFAAGDVTSVKSR